MASTASMTPSAPPKPKRAPKPQQVKYVIAQQSSDGGQPQQLVLDASQLQGLLQGSGNTITLSGSSGKVLNLMLCFCYVSRQLLPS
jgi:hypothetical protein